MTPLKATTMLLVAVLALLWMSRGSAQQESLGDTGLTVRQDDLDSFWLDTNNWYWYGYRPYAKAHVTRYAPGLPAWSATTPDRGGYSFGITEPAGNQPWEGGPSPKFQLSKGGTWH
jgi:hypothetical protein